MVSLLVIWACKVRDPVFCCIYGLCLLHWETPIERLSGFTWFSSIANTSDCVWFCQMVRYTVEVTTSHSWGPQETWLGIRIQASMLACLLCWLVLVISVRRVICTRLAVRGGKTLITGHAAMKAHWQLFGCKKASSDGGLNIEPDAWGENKESRKNGRQSISRFPAQVIICAWTSWH